MEQEKSKLYERLSNKNESEDYIPVIETNKGYYMIWEDKIAKCSRESRRGYESYLEAKKSDIDKKEDRFNKLKIAIELDREKKKGIWFELEGFVNKLESEDIELIKESIKKYK